MCSFPDSTDCISEKTTGGVLDDIETLGELVSYNKNDLLKFRNFGKKSLTELEDLVEGKNLTFGMDVSKYKLDKE